MFQAYPEYDAFRTLKLSDVRQRGEDVFALQTTLGVLGYELEETPEHSGGCDGVLGPDTAKGIRFVQTKLKIVVDGLAGGGTQQAICKFLCNNSGVTVQGLPKNLEFGQVMHESSCRLGRFSPIRADVDAVQAWQPLLLKGKSFDAGATQQNSAHFHLVDAFDVPLAIHKLALNTKKHYDMFAGVDNMRRRWELAAGSWNAPAYAKFIANEEGARVPKKETAVPSSASRAKLEAYMDSVTAMMELS